MNFVFKITKDGHVLETMKIFASCLLIITTCLLQTSYATEYRISEVGDWTSSDPYSEGGDLASELHEAADGDTILFENALDMGDETSWKNGGIFPDPNNNAESVHHAGFEFQNTFRNQYWF